MMKNPLIEMAEHEDKAAAASNKYARIPMAERHRKRHERNARILRAAAAVIEAHYSHVDGRNLPASLHPDTWHMCDIKVRRNGRDEYFEGDWLKNVAKELAVLEAACSGGQK